MCRRFNSVLGHHFLTVCTGRIGRVGQLPAESDRSLEGSGRPVKTPEPRSDEKGAAFAGGPSGSDVLGQRQTAPTSGPVPLETC